MAGKDDNLVLEHLRAIRAGLVALYAETRNRLVRPEASLAAIEQTSGGICALSGPERKKIHTLTRCSERRRGISDV